MHGAHNLFLQKILVVGTGDSAIDICLQSIPYAKPPIYTSQRTPHLQFPTVFSRPGVEVVSIISHLTADTIHLIDGRVLTDIDTIVFATGYLGTYPFLSSNIRPPPVAGYRIPSLYRHIFDMHNPETIAFNGVADNSLSWLTWEKTAFLIALLWAGKIHLPPKEEMEAWESRRFAETGNRGFHLLVKASERVVYWDELNELAAEYLGEENTGDVLLRSFPFKWIVELLKSRQVQAKLYGITNDVLGLASVGAYNGKRHGIGSRRTFCAMFCILISGDSDESSPTVQRSYLRCGCALALLPAI
jgi:Flavin-binding monooxygenase-like